MKNNTEADKIIKTHMMISMGVGLMPLPIIDVIAVTAVQVDMLRQLAKNYNIDFNDQAGKSIISSISGSVMARIGASSVKAIPIIGSILGSVTMSALSGASTFAIGNVFKEHFKKGGNLADIDIDKAKSFFKEKMKEGKEMAKEMESEIKEKAEEIKDNATGERASTDEPVADNSIKSLTDQLKTIAKMKDDGLLTEDEFNVLKKKILDRQNAS